MFLFLIEKKRERVRDCASRRGAGDGWVWKESEAGSRLPTVRSAQTAPQGGRGVEFTNWDHDLDGSQNLSRLNHSGASFHCFNLIAKHENLQFRNVKRKLKPRSHIFSFKQFTYSLEASFPHFQVGLLGRWVGAELQQDSTGGSSPFSTSVQGRDQQTLVDQLPENLRFHLFAISFGSIWFH